MEALHFEDLNRIDQEIRDWGHQGFADIALIIHDDKKFYPDSPSLSVDDILHQRVTNMELRGGDLFVFIDNGDILHYRMTVERV